MSTNPGFEDRTMAIDDRPTDDTMIDACLRLHEIVRKIGTPEMVLISRLLLYQAGLQIADAIKADEARDSSTEH